MLRNRWIRRPAPRAGGKPKHPYPVWMRRILRRALPERIYRRYVGRHEDESIRKWRRLAAHVPAGRAILDIGSFHGEYALAAREVSSHADVFAFEPNPEALNVLRRSTQGRSITVVEAAVSDADRQVSFVCRSAEGASADQSESAGDNRDVVTVPAVSLDAWLSQQGVVPGLIKIDVEGGEHRILRGAARALAAHRPIILCEILSDAAGEAVSSALPVRYRFVRVDENRGVVEEPRITRREWRNKNWILVPQERRADVFSIRDIATCPACRADSLQRSKTRSAYERLMKRIRRKRLHRCASCGWRGWTVPFERSAVRGIVATRMRSVTTEPFPPLMLDHDESHVTAAGTPAVTP